MTGARRLSLPDHLQARRRSSIFSNKSQPCCHSSKIAELDLSKIMPCRTCYRRQSSDDADIDCSSFVHSEVREEWKFDLSVCKTILPEAVKFDSTPPPDLKNFVNSKSSLTTNVGDTGEIKKDGTNDWMQFSTKHRLSSKSNQQDCDNENDSLDDAVDELCDQSSNRRSSLNAFGMEEQEESPSFWRRVSNAFVDFGDLIEETYDALVHNSDSDNKSDCGSDDEAEDDENELFFPARQEFEAANLPPSSGFDIIKSHFEDDKDIGNIMAGISRLQKRSESLPVFLSSKDIFILPGGNVLTRPDGSNVFCRAQSEPEEVATLETPDAKPIRLHSRDAAEAFSYVQFARAMYSVLYCKPQNLRWFWEKGKRCDDTSSLLNEVVENHVCDFTKENILFSSSDSTSSHAIFLHPDLEGEVVIGIRSSFETLSSCSNQKQGSDSTKSQRKKCGSNTSSEGTGVQSCTLSKRKSNTPASNRNSHSIFSKTSVTYKDMVERQVACTDLKDLVSAPHNSYGELTNWGPVHVGMLKQAVSVLQSITPLFPNDEHDEMYAAGASTTSFNNPQLPDADVLLLHRAREVLKNAARISIVGHGIGGGVAAYLALLLDEMLSGDDAPEIHAYTFGAPPVLDEEHADSDRARKLISSYIHDEDMVPRLSNGHLARLKKEALEVQVDDSIPTCLYPAGRKILFWQEKGSTTSVIAADVGLGPFQTIPLRPDRMLFDSLPLIYEEMLALWESGAQCIIDADLPSMAASHTSSNPPKI